MMTDAERRREAEDIGRFQRECAGVERRGRSAPRSSSPPIPRAVPTADPSLPLDTRIAEEATRQRIKREVRRLLDAEDRGPLPEPALRTLRERLKQPRPATRWRIERFQPAQTRAMLAAQYKGGKTTLIGCLLRSMLDGDPFLGHDAVAPLAGTVAIVDTEMPPQMVEDWLRAQRIRHDDRVILETLRGQVAAFDLLDPRVRARWAAMLRERKVEYLVLDCLRPVLDTFGLDESREAGRFLVAFDALLDAAQIPDALVVHHMGHLNERSRGDSRLRDWPDVEWRLVRQTDAPDSPRFISAYGRDVDVPESRLDYDPATRRLTIAGGSRQDAAAASALEAVAAAVVAALATAKSPLSGRQIKEALDGAVARNKVDAALHGGVAAGRLHVESGPKNAKLYRLATPVSGVSHECPGDTACECPAAYMQRDTHTLNPTDASPQRALGHSTPTASASAIGATPSPTEEEVPHDGVF